MKLQRPTTAPPLYSQDGQGMNAVIHEHYFIGSCDWLVTEYDPEQDLAFGWACLGDRQNAELGYVSGEELESVKVPLRVDLESYGMAEPLVYRHWCFDGEVAIVQVDDTTKAAIDVMSFYDSRWRRLDLQYDPRGYHRDFARPAGLDEMIAVASKLSRGIPFVRVDLYNVAGQTYFSEMTFTPRGGELIFEPPQWDMILGAKWAAPGSIATSEELAPPEDERIAAIA